MPHAAKPCFAATMQAGETGRARGPVDRREYGGNTHAESARLTDATGS
jgi:hypothetical protein